MTPKSLLTLATLAGLFFSPPSFAEKQLSVPTPIESKRDKEAKEKLFLRLGFGYRTLNRGERMEDYVDKTREQFTAMRGFGEFLQLGKQLPYFFLEVGLSPETNFLSRDSLELRISGAFSSSAIFGDSTSQKDFETWLMEWDLGSTPTNWTQHLDCYVALGVGVSYSPIAFGKYFQVRPAISLSGGISYIKAESILDIRMKGNESTQIVGKETLNLLGINEKIYAVTPQSGWGYFVEPAGEFQAQIGKYFLIRLKLGYRHEIFPNLNMVTTTELDTKTTREEVNIKYEACGFDGQLTFGVQLP